MADDLAVYIDKKTGAIRALYDDRLLPYIERLKAELGLPDSAVQITRATHVEPDPERVNGGNWFIDLAPSGGPLVHCDEEGHPFVQRQAALDFERRWLMQHWLREGA